MKLTNASMLLLRRQAAVSRGCIRIRVCSQTRSFASTSWLSTESPTVEYLKPYVALPYSYAFGRSNRQLVYKTIGNLLDERVANESGQATVISHHEQIRKTFTEFNEDVNRMAKAIHENLELSRGDVIGLWSCNTYRWIVIQYACARLGIILCTINPFYQTPELDYALRKGKVKALFLPGTQSPQDQVNNFTKILQETVHLKDSPNADPLLLQHVVAIDGQSFNSNDLATQKVHHFDQLVAGKNSDLDSKVLSAVSPDDPLMIMFTSGTTGKPKGAYLSHFTTANNAILTAQSLGTVGESMKVCVPLPFFHSFAGVLGNIAMVAAPFQLIIPSLRYNVKELVESMSQNNATHILATPTLAIDLLNYLKKSKIQLPTLKSLLAGGASVPVEIAHQFCDVVPSCVDFRIGYGATELGPCVTACRDTDTFQQRTETVGRPLDLVEVKVINPHTKELVKVGETGEIHSRGHNVMLGYWMDEAKTKECIDHAGWYNTGDLGVLDAEGFLTISGRTKELIIVGGENVYPREIEELLHTHPEIVDVHVVGLPDKRRGEEVCAWVKLANPKSSLTEEDLRDFCKKNITYFKVPKYIMFVDSFPITATGKAQKFIMREISIKKLNLQ